MYHYVNDEGKAVATKEIPADFVRTPGPWVVELFNEGTPEEHLEIIHYCDHTDDECAIDYGPSEIARIDFMGGTGAREYGNAYAIAAVPELIKALETIHDEADHALNTEAEIPLEILKANMLAILAAAREALAKAKHSR